MTATIEPLAVGMTEAARLLGVSRPTVYKLANQAGFPVFAVGGRRMVSVEGLRRWIEAQTKEATQNGGCCGWG